ncbi:MAG: MtrB/PioB family outer membrane beta-barrel protein [Nitrospirae bacterium]|nr:MtrB/PioB family outer membrane beta-barrel protein [Nitrospirota bacterium]
MKKLLIIFIIILFIPNIVLCDDGSGETVSTPAESPSPSPPPVKGGGIISETTPAREEGKEQPAAPTPAETTVKEPTFENISIMDISGKFQDMKIFTDSPKSREYKTIPEGTYIDNFHFILGSGTQEISGNAGNIKPLTNLNQDGYWNLSYRKYGLLDVDTGLNRFIRTYDGSGTSSTDSSNILKTRDINNISVEFRPGDKLIITTRLSVEESNGRSPVSFENFTKQSGVPRTAIREITEPKDYKTTTIGINMEYIDDSVDIQLDNNFDIFTNRLTDDITWANLFKGSDGRAKGAGDYTVHTLSLRPSIKLSNNITFYNTLSFSKVTSTIDLIPFTTIPDVGGEFLRNKIDSDVRNLTLSTALSAKLFSNLRFNIKYRHYAHKNDTPNAKETPSYIMIDGGDGKDGGVNAIRYPRIARYTAYYTDSIILDGTWSPASRLYLNTLIENKDTSRDEREVEKENEKKAQVTMRTVILNSLATNLGYTYSKRTGKYDPTYYNAIYDPDTLNTVTQHTLLRTFDLSELASQKISAGIDYSPIEAFSLGLNFSYLLEEHNNVTIGRIRSQGTSGSVSLQIEPFTFLQFYTEYYYDKKKTTGRYSWTYDNNLSYTKDTKYTGFTKPITGILEDTSNVLTAGFNIKPGKRFSIKGDYSKYDFAGADSKLPEVSNITDTYEVYISAKLRKEQEDSSDSEKYLKNASITAGYYMERYVRSDYALDNFPDTGPDKFIGIREPSYKYRLISLYMSVYF